MEVEVDGGGHSSPGWGRWRGEEAEDSAQLSLTHL